MNLLASSSFCVIFCLSVQIAICADYLLGCYYQSIGYLSPDVRAAVTGYSKYRKTSRVEGSAVFGGIIKPAIIENEKMLNDTLLAFEDILARLVSEIPYNTFDDLGRFHRQFIGRTDHKKKEDFRADPYGVLLKMYDEYKPQYFADTGSSGLVFELMNRIIAVFEEFEDNVYVATAYVGAPTEYVAAQQWYPELDAANFVNNYLVGVFKYILNGKYGYVLLDPTSGRVKLIHVRERQFEFNENLVSGSGWSRFRMLPHVKNGKMASAYMIHGEMENSNNSEGVINTLYYIKNPFCSPMKIIAKRDFLEPTRILEKRDAQGRVMLKISVKLLPLPHIHEKAYFTLEFCNNNLSMTYGTKEFTSKAMRRKILGRINPVAINFGYATSNEFMEKVANIGFVARDDVFLILYNKLIYEKTGKKFDENALSLPELNGHPSN